MRLPVVKILWGMFAFPMLYPRAFLVAGGPPLAGIMAASIAWAVLPIESVTSKTGMALMLVNWVLFPWLAVRIHRLVLLGDHRDGAAPRLRSVASYFAATIAGGLVFSIFLALLLMRYVPTNNGSPDVDAVVKLPMWISTALQLAPLYLLARLVLVLPGIALGHDWRLRDAWRLSRGNGWRLFVAVMLLPWGFSLLVDLAGQAMDSRIIDGGFAMIEALLSACGVIALSLAYRELEEPAPPPTDPPA
jgi:hypothetical protein